MIILVTPSTPDQVPTITQEENKKKKTPKWPVVSTAVRSKVILNKRFSVSQIACDKVELLRITREKQGLWNFADVDWLAPPTPILNY